MNNASWLESKNGFSKWNCSKRCINHFSYLLQYTVKDFERDIVSHNLANVRFFPNVSSPTRKIVWDSLLTIPVIDEDPKNMYLYIFIYVQIYVGTHIGAYAYRSYFSLRVSGSHTQSPGLGLAHAGRRTSRCRKLWLRDAIFPRETSWASIDITMEAIPLRHLTPTLPIGYSASSSESDAPNSGRPARRFSSHFSLFLSRSFPYF